MKNLVITLTPPGTAAIAVIRMKGDAVPGFLERYFSGKPLPGKCVHGMLTDGSKTIDDPVVVLSADGAFADINLHGGAWVVRSFLNLAETFGFEVIEQHGGPLNSDTTDGTSEIENKILSHLPLATTEFALQELLRQKTAWQTLNDLPNDTRRNELQAMRGDVGLWWLLHPPRVAIVGPPNVGKSTLANHLFGQERSITADLPGTTRDWVGETVNLDGLAVLLMDTPGLRGTADMIEATAIERAVDEIENSDLVILVLDSTQSLASEHLTMIEQYAGAIRVANKCDLPRAWDWECREFLPVSAKTGEGIKSLVERIQSYFGVHQRPRSARWWTQSGPRSLGTPGEKG